MGDGNSLELVVDDKAYRLGRPGWMVRLRAEERVREVMRGEFDAALRGLSQLSPGEVRAACMGAFESLRRSAIVGTDMVSLFLLSHSGTLFLFREALALHHPGISQADSDAVFNALTVEQYQEMDEFLSGAVFPRHKQLADAVKAAAEKSKDTETGTQTEAPAVDGAQAG